MEAERSQDSFPVYLKTELAEKFQKFRGHKHTTTQPNYHDEKYFDYTFEKDYFIEQKIIQKVHGCRSVVKCSNPKCKQRGWVERQEEPTRVRVIGDLQCLKPVDKRKVFCCKECLPHPAPPNLIIFITPTGAEKEAITELQEDCEVELYTQVRVCSCQGCKDFKLFENHVERDTMVALGTYK